MPLCNKQRACNPSFLVRQRTITRSGIPLHRIFYILPSESSSDTPDFTLHPRRLWNLSRLGEPDPCQLYQDTFRSSSAPLLSQLKRLVQHPPSSRPPIDDLNASLNNIIYRSLDSSVGDRPPRPSHWKKYWTKQLQDAADFRNRCYRRWRRAFGIDKVYCCGHCQTSILASILQVS
ncbi:hypothetical protein G6F66_013896 [Rhizopus arrhizus]|nr:hypothetical protein G6F66_013896 [Rhizopus arrhizus]